MSAQQLVLDARADNIAKVTAADVQRVAKQSLVKTGRTVVLGDGKAAPPAKEAVMARTRGVTFGVALAALSFQRVASRCSSPSSPHQAASRRRPAGS